MLLPKCALLFGLILTILLEPISAKRGFSGGHSYPKSGGLSGGGHRTGGGLSGGGHGYPSSGTHKYPSGGLSGGSHGYPSSGGNHGYPSSGGNHGYPSSGGSSYPKPGSGHTYPSSGNNHGYPSSGGGLSGNNHGYPANKPVHTTNVHTTNHYHYSPPASINYRPPQGGAPVSYPVYHGTPPSYVYHYKDSGSKYGTLLAGLALLNLGTLGVAGYAAAKASQNGHSGTGQYKPQPGEVCKFAIKKENGDYEETRIDCAIISNFILQADSNTQNAANNSTVTTTTTVTNVTIVNTTNVDHSQHDTTTVQPMTFAVQANGTLLQINGTDTNNTIANATIPETSDTSSVVTSTTTITNTTLVSALDVKGQPVTVTPGMQCFVTKVTPISRIKKTVPCGLLQAYADQSIQKKNSASRHVPMITIFAAVVAYCVGY